MRYGVDEVKKIDLDFGLIIDEFLLTDYKLKRKIDLWNDLCNYIHRKIGNYDLNDYKSIQKINK